MSSATLHQRAIAGIDSEGVRELSLPPVETSHVFNGDGTDNNFVGTGSGDAFHMEDGGHDTVKGRGGNDKFFFGANWDTADRIFGGTGEDTLNLDGDYTSGFLHITSAMLAGVERIDAVGGHTYKLLVQDVQAGELLTIDGSLAASLNVIASGNDGPLAIIGSPDTDTLQTDASACTFDGGDGTDFVHMGAGTVDLKMGADNDTVYAHAALDNGDQIDGGDGSDTVEFTNVSLNLHAHTIQNVEVFKFDNLNSFSLTTDNGTVAAGGSLFVDGTVLGATHTLSFNGSAETNGTFHIVSGQGNDHLKGGRLSDTIDGGDGKDKIFGNLGADNLTGGAGRDTFGYLGTGDSTGQFHDNVISFDATQDKFDLPVAVSAIDGDISGGHLDGGASFDTDLAAAVTSATLQENDAVIFLPDSGDFDGRVILVVDGNAKAGYQAGHDFVFDLASAVNTALTTANFI